jgi:PAT family beta-lactamase induction signal transducer AmpG
MDGNWPLFFALTALMVIPSLLFLWSIKEQVDRIENQNKITSS